MKKLSDYTDSSLTGSLLEKKSKNQFFPDFFGLFANVQVATPVIATVNSSPWSTFKDDIIMNIARTLGGALPPNLNTSGTGLPPQGDMMGHNFVKAYLGNEESKNKILSDIQNQYNTLKYPIAYSQNAVFLQSHWRYSGEDNHLHSSDPALFFDIVSSSNHDIGGNREERPNSNEIIHQTYAKCFDLPEGSSKITLAVDSKQKQDVSFEVWTGEKNPQEAPKTITFPVKRGNSRWEVGTIRTEKGTGKEPVKVTVSIYPQPKIL